MFQLMQEHRAIRAKRKSIADDYAQYVQGGPISCTFLTLHISGIVQDKMKRIYPNVPSVLTSVDKD